VAGLEATERGVRGRVTGVGAAALIVDRRIFVPTLLLTRPDAWPDGRRVQRGDRVVVDVATVSARRQGGMDFGRCRLVATRVEPRAARGGAEDGGARESEGEEGAGEGAGDSADADLEGARDSSSSSSSSSGSGSGSGGGGGDAQDAARKWSKGRFPKWRREALRTGDLDIAAMAIDSIDLEAATPLPPRARHVRSRAMCPPARARRLRVRRWLTRGAGRAAGGGRLAGGGAGGGAGHSRRVPCTPPPRAPRPPPRAPRAAPCPPAPLLKGGAAARAQGSGGARRGACGGRAARDRSPGRGLG
jgi:hypothetical protein